MFRHIVFALGLLVMGLAVCQASDLPTPEEVAAIVRSESFGPAIGVVNDDVTTGTTFSPVGSVSTSIGWGYEPYIDSVELSDDGQFLFVIYRQPSNLTFATIPPQQCPDSVWRVVYGIKYGMNGVPVISKIGEQPAKVTPEKVIDEVIEFDEFCKDCQ